MNKKELTVNLIRYRFVRNGVLAGMTVGEAALHAEQRIKNDGVYGLLDALKVMGMPEGGIVGIVETYWKLMIQQLEAGAALSVRGNQSRKRADD